MTPVEVDDDRPDSDVLRFGGTSEPVVWPVVPDAGCVPALGIEIDCRPGSAPTIPKEVFEPLFAPPVLTTTPGPADVVGPLEGFADPEPDPLADDPDAFEVDPDDVEGDPPEAGVAHATP